MNPHNRFIPFPVPKQISTYLELIMVSGILRQNCRKSFYRADPQASVLNAMCFTKTTH